MILVHPLVFVHSLIFVRASVRPCAFVRAFVRKIHKGSTQRRSRLVTCKVFVDLATRPDEIARTHDPPERRGELPFAELNDEEHEAEGPKQQHH